MSSAPHWAAAAVAFHLFIELALMVRVLLRPHRQPASRIAWVVVIFALPVVGILAYLLFGEVNIGRRRVARLRKVLEGMPDFPAAVPGDEANLEAKVPERYAQLFRVGRSISGFEPVGGNSAHLLATSIAAYVNAGLLFRALYRRRIYRPRAGWRKYLSQIGLAASVMAAVLWWGAPALPEWTAWPAYHRGLVLLAWVCAGSAAYFLALRAGGLRVSTLWHGEHAAGEGA